MCHGPSCPNECRTVSADGKSKRSRMVRAYIRIRDERRKMRTVPVGWWCPACHAFMDENRAG